MSLVPRVRSTHPSKSKSWRRPILIVSILVALILIGTVIVLSSATAFFGVPPSTLISEVELPWKDGRDAIMPLAPTPITDDGDLSYPYPQSSAEEADPTSFDTRSKAWRDIDADASTADLSTDAPDVSDELDEAIPPPTTPDDTSDEWGVDGKGTGGYWMRQDWDGRVHNTTSWQRLENIPLREGEKIPRIIHQTWKTDKLPPKWRTAWKECREGMPDYEYMLWTDETAREFVKQYYPSFQHMYDNYRYPIQRADSIRYMILHHFGGVYMDLDIGCRRRIDPLLQGDWEVLLPITNPVGVSNDLLVSAKNSEFMERTVNGLRAFNHEYILNYPTVMFSTGPMFLSAQFSLWRSGHAKHLVRVLPMSLYGKNAPQEDVPHSFFSHFYGSSWHADDSGFIIWLGTWGKGVMLIGFIFLIIAGARLVLAKKQTALRHVLPFGKRNEYQLLPVGMPYDASGRVSPSSSFGSGPLSPSSEVPPDFSGALRRAGSIILAAPAALVASSNSGNRQRQKGWLYFVPSKLKPQTPTGRRRTASEASQLPHHRRAPPPYEPADGTMDEVDAFLKSEIGGSTAVEPRGLGTPVVPEEDEEASGSDSGNKRRGTGDWEKDSKWDEWGGEGSGK